MQTENLEDLRKQIDTLDDILVDAFVKRMEVSDAIAAVKSGTSKPVLDTARERIKLADVASKVPEDLTNQVVSLFNLLMQMSRSRQRAHLHVGEGLATQIEQAIEATPKLFPSRVPVACQGVDGAFSELACEKLFKTPLINFFGSFESVFDAVEAGLCRYGVIPIENSAAGSVNLAYDLLMSRGLTIVRTIRLKVDHNLIVKPGCDISQITKVISHEQALHQSQAYLKNLGVTTEAVANTALAAAMVAESDDPGLAAIGSLESAAIRGLDCADTSIQDRQNNYTRFAVISRNLEIYPGADRTSITMALPHEPGSLYKVLSRFYAAGVNLIKLESRPIPQRDFEFMFYFDLQTSVYSPDLLKLLAELSQESTSFKYLGSYSEVI